MRNFNRERFEGDTVARSIVGIGVNLNNPLPAELKNTATSVYEITGRKADIDTFTATLAYNLYQKYDIDEYRRSLGILGKKIKIIRGDETYEGKRRNSVRRRNHGKIKFLRKTIVILRDL